MTILRVRLLLLLYRVFIRIFSFFYRYCWSLSYGLNPELRVASSNLSNPPNLLIDILDAFDTRRLYRPGFG